MEKEIRKRLREIDNLLDNYEENKKRVKNPVLCRFCLEHLEVEDEKEDCDKNSRYSECKDCPERNSYKLRYNELMSHNFKMKNYLFVCDYKNQPDQTQMFSSVLKEFFEPLFEKEKEEPSSPNDFKIDNYFYNNIYKIGSNNGLYAHRTFILVTKKNCYEISEREDLSNGVDKPQYFWNIHYNKYRYSEAVRKILNNDIEFIKKYCEAVNHNYCSMTETTDKKELFSKLYGNIFIGHSDDDLFYDFLQNFSN